MWENVITVYNELANTSDLTIHLCGKETSSCIRHELFGQTASNKGFYIFYQHL